MSLLTSKIFQSTRSTGKQKDYNAVGPLDAATAWAKEHLYQGVDQVLSTPMLLFNEEMQRQNGSTFRQMIAIDISTMLETAHGRTTPLYYHEIIPTDGPAKLAFDLEVKFGEPKERDRILDAFGTLDETEVSRFCDALQNRLTKTALTMLSEQVGRELDESGVILLDCCRPGKYSRHLVFDCSDDSNPSVVFSSDRDCEEFVRRLLARPELQNFQKQLKVLVDTGVYASRHPLRTYYSAKRASPALWLRIDAGPCDGRQFARALRSCFVTHSAPGEFYRQTKGTTRYVTSLYVLDDRSTFPATITLVAPTAKRMSAYTALGVSSSSTALGAHPITHGAASGHLISALLTAPDFEEYRLKKGRFSDQTTIIVDCETLECSAHERGAHSENHRCVYLKIDLLHRTYVQLCNSSNCKANRTIDPPRNKPLPASVQDAVTRYLNDDWALGSKVGDDFVAALGNINKG